MAHAKPNQPMQWKEEEKDRGGWVCVEQIKFPGNTTAQVVAGQQGKKVCVEMCGGRGKR